MRLAFVDPISWDYRVESPYQQPLGGSQSALCYLAEAIAQQGQDVFLLNHTAAPGISRGVVCLPFNRESLQLLKALVLDAVIVLNSSALGRQIKPLLTGKTRLVLWTQHAADQPDMQALHEAANRDIYDAIAFVSHWQQEQCCRSFGITPERTQVLQNAIAPAFCQLFSADTAILPLKSQPPVLAYTSTPFRGLELLLDLFPLIRQAIPQVRLKVFSSMQVYQATEAEDTFRPLYDRCRQMKGVEYIGALSQPELARELRSVSALAYPNIFLETFCIAVLEAIAAGCQVITSDLAALPETTAGFAQLISIQSFESSASRFVSFTAATRQDYIHRFVERTVQVLQLMTANPPILEADLRKQVEYVNRFCTWSVQAQAWTNWLSKLGDQVEMRQLERQAVAADPTSVTSNSLLQAAEWGQAGRFAEASAVCQQVLQQQPENARAWNLLGLAAFQSDRPKEALSYIKKAVSLEPVAAEFHNHLGTVYCSLGDLASGVVCYRRAVTLQPQSVETHYNLGLALQRQNHLQEAIAHYQQVVALQPRHAQAHLNLANAFQQQQQFDPAIAHYQQALTIQPTADGWHGLGLAQQALGELDEAVHCYRQGLVANPTSAKAHNNLGTVLQTQGKAQQAIAHYQQALMLKPNYVPALTNLGNLCLKQERFSEAEVAYRQVLNQEPENLQVLDGLVKLLEQTCRWADLEPLSDRLMTLTQAKLDRGLPTGVMPLNTLLLPFSPAQQQAIAQEHAIAIAQSQKTRRQQLNFTFPRRPQSPPNRLRIGYVSGDFRDHPVAHLIRQLFGLHNRAQFEVFAYSLGPNDGSHYRQKMMADCDRFTEIGTLTPTASARQIYGDEIDILVDLAGYTEYSSPHLFALRPAPIQVNYLGYPGTMGADFIDYILTDSILTPPHQTQFFTEKCVYLPHCYQINDNQQPLSDTVLPKHTWGLPNEAFVYCCFNRSRKIEPQIFTTWMRILSQVPNSVLWLFQSYPEAEQHLKQEAEACGINGDRLIFAPRLPKAAHLTRLPAADLFLDTLFYNAHTTASDALWAGVPLITQPGETFASRVAASLLSALGLPELITPNLATYERLAVHLAQHPQNLHQLKVKLAANRLTSPLYETERSLRDLEKAYWLMWRVYESEETVRSLVVPPD